jgi:hypothetical protein
VAGRIKRALDWSSLIAKVRRARRSEFEFTSCKTKTGRYPQLKVAKYTVCDMTFT